MTTTYTEAQSEVKTLFFQGWKAGAGAVVGYVPQVYWTGDQKPAPPDASKYWARCTTETVTAGQTAMGMGTDYRGRLRYTEFGFVMIEIFCPRNVGDGLTKIKQLGELARGLFRGAQTPGCVWFRLARINEQTPLDNYYRLHVVADYQYDEIQ